MAYSNFYGWFYVIRQQIGAALLAVWNLSFGRYYLVALILAQIIAWLESVFIYRNLSGDLLILHYNVDFGVDLVGMPARIFTYPLIGLGVIALNLALAAASHNQKDFRAFVHFLLAAALVFGLFLNLALLFVYLINFR